MKLRNKKTGKVYSACCIWFGESLEGLDKTKWKTLKEFCEDFEDINPAEPLIKDEKVRKIVRAWADLYDNSTIRVYIDEEHVSLFNSESLNIDIPGNVFRELIDKHYYTIAELCGEDEE